jgi:hypothetical protein
MRVYVNWDSGEVVGPIGADKVIKARAAEYMDDGEAFFDWLSERYTLWDVWSFGEDEKAEIKEKYFEFCRESAHDWFDENFCEHAVD